MQTISGAGSHVPLSGSRTASSSILQTGGSPSRVDFPLATVHRSTQIAVEYVAGQNVCPVEGLSPYCSSALSKSARRSRLRAAMVIFNLSIPSEAPHRPLPPSERNRSERTLDISAGPVKVALSKREVDLQCSRIPSFSDTPEYSRSGAIPLRSLILASQRERILVGDLPGCVECQVR